jgi:hypothetical protein
MFDSIVARRLIKQKIEASTFESPRQVVHWLGGIQAQDDNWAKWSIGLRLPIATDTAVTQSITDFTLIRTWAFRGTLHLVDSADVGWLTALLAPTLIAGNARRYRQLELENDDFIKCHRILEKVLGKERPLTRSQIAHALEKEGLSAAGQRTPYLLQRAALDGLICLDQPQGRESTYTLLGEKISSRRALTGQEALAELALRYFTSHGPATAVDFIRWSGLPAADARRGIESIQSLLVAIQNEGAEYWLVEPNAQPPAIPSPTAHCLPPFDEYLLGYKERSAALASEHVKKVNAGGGMPKPAIILDGKVAGVWQRTQKKQALHISTEVFEALNEEGETAVTQALARFAQFCEMPVEM